MNPRRLTPREARRLLALTAVDMELGGGLLARTVGEKKHPRLFTAPDLLKRLPGFFYSPETCLCSGYLHPPVRRQEEKGRK